MKTAVLLLRVMWYPLQSASAASQGEGNRAGRAEVFLKPPAASLQLGSGKRGRQVYL